MMISIRRALVVLALSVGLLGAGQATVASASAATTVTVAPAAPLTPPDNCYPFGIGSGWPPFMGNVYQNVPPFQLKTGDLLGFDMTAMNDADVQLQIELAPTTANGGDAPSLPFTTVVTNTQTPTNPRGDTTLGNYEMGFTAQAPFNFAGGGLIVRFSNPSAPYATDLTCTSVLGGATSSDPSGYFVKRFYSDADGVPPYAGTATTYISGFRLTLADVPAVPAQAGPTGQRAAALKSCKKRAHKHHWSHKRLKKCKRKANLLPL
jgi:hypothetical protein